MKKFLIIWSVLSVLVIGTLIYKFRVLPTVVPTRNAEISIGTLLQETNIERVNAGLPALVLDPNLNASALDKCNDMVAKNYWDHNAPDGTQPWPFIIKHTGYRAAGENLSTGINDSDQVVAAWIASPKHKENIVNPVYDNVGFAICGAQPMVVQHFIDVL